ncbi:hypothetical protein ACW73L_01405 [Methylolobus aquaticus]
MLGGFVARAAVALVSENILWPDEIFQYLEQGHRAVFGYGYIPWEFRYAARSWLLPGFIAFWLWLCKTAQLDAPSFYVPFIKLVFCALSTTLIFSAYRTGRNLAGARAGLLAALLVAGWYELIYFAHKPLTEAVATYTLVASLAFATEPRPVQRQAFWYGLFAGLAVVLRPQYAPCVGIIGLYGLFRWPVRATASAAAAGFAAVLLAGAVDRLTWGGWFETFIVSYRLNAVMHVSEWFGTLPTLWYAGAISATSAGLLWLPLSLGWVRRLSVSRLPVVCAAAVLATHSLIAHKEYRFVVGALPLLWLTAAVLLERALATRLLDRRGALMAIAVFFAVSALGLTYRLPGQVRVYDAGPLLGRSPNLDAYLALSQAHGLGALLSNEDGRFAPPVLGTGGYYYLHRRVPVYFPSELRAAGETPASFRDVVTHFLGPADAPAVEGFTLQTALGALEIWRRSSGAGSLRPVCIPYAPADGFVDQALLGLRVHRALPGNCR